MNPLWDTVIKAMTVDNSKTITIISTPKLHYYGIHGDEKTVYVKLDKDGKPVVEEYLW